MEYTKVPEESLLLDGEYRVPPERISLPASEYYGQKEVRETKFVKKSVLKSIAALLSVVTVVSASYGIGKAGGCIVIDFGNGTAEVYVHGGASKNFIPGGTFSAGYSVGLVENYTGFGAYSGPFVEAGGTIGHWGFSHCESPTNDPNRCSATCFTISTGSSAYVEYDYYVSVFQIGTGRTSQNVSNSTIVPFYYGGGGGGAFCCREMTR